MVRQMTTKEAAETLGVSQARIRQLILRNQLKAQKFGRDLMILESDLKKVPERKLGRPPKKKKDA